MVRRFPAGVLVAVAAGGAAGTLLRAWLETETKQPSAGFPWVTLSINLAGSAVLGFVIIATIERAVPSTYVRPLIGTGLCGGLTTFSTFAVGTDLLVRADRAGLAVAYGLATLTGGLVAARAGMVLARAAWRRDTGD